MNGKSNFAKFNQNVADSDSGSSVSSDASSTIEKKSKSGGAVAKPKIKVSEGRIH